MKKFRILIALVLLLSFTVIPVPVKAEAPYYVVVDVTNQIVTVYSTADDSVVRQMICSTGTAKNPSPQGNFTMPYKHKAMERTEWYTFEDGFGKYGVRIYTNYLFHSYLFTRKDMDCLDWDTVASLGTQASHGCIRLYIADAYWMAMNLTEGTKCKIYHSGEDLGFVRELLTVKTFSIDDGISYEQFCSVATREGELGYGSTGEAVAAFQEQLSDLGLYAGEFDGIYGPYMVRLVKILEETIGLPVDGIADAELFAALDSPSAPTSTMGTFDMGSVGAGVSLLQAALQKLGLYTASVTGEYDQATADAVSLFQQIDGQAQTGVATPAVQADITSAVAALEEKYGEGGYALYTTDVDTAMARNAAESRLNVRKSQSTSSTIMAYLPAGETCLVLEKGDEWTKVRVGDTNGYLMNKYLEFFTDTQREYSYGAADATHPAPAVDDVAFAGTLIPARVVTYGVSTSTNRLLVRSERDTDGSVIFKIPPKVTFTVLEEDNGWSLVTYGGKTGYILSKYVETTTSVELTPPEKEPEPGVIGYARIIQFKNPGVYGTLGEDSTIVAELIPGTEIGIVSMEDEAVQVYYHGVYGYVSTKLVTLEKLYDVENPVPMATPAPEATLPPAEAPAVEPTEAPAATELPPEASPLPTLPPLGTPAPAQEPTEEPYPTVTVDTGSSALLSLRTAASRDSQVLDTLESGTVLEVVSDLGEWLYVRIGGVYGYVMAEYTK